MAAISIEQMADAVQWELWVQLYVLKDHAFNDQLVDRAWQQAIERWSSRSISRPAADANATCATVCRCL
jgi:isopentenyl diphosphate isomerase/L-lactate dehydrogenase-like FMN-dependent dehydrogenase